MAKQQDFSVAELRKKIRATEIKLSEIQEYKALIGTEGGKPDLEDKERESRVVAQLVKFQKILADKEGRPYISFRAQKKTSEKGSKWNSLKSSKPRSRNFSQTKDRKVRP